MNFLWGAPKGRSGIFQGWGIPPPNHSILIPGAQLNDLLKLSPWTVITSGARNTRGGVAVYSDDAAESCLQSAQTWQLTNPATVLWKFAADDWLPPTGSLRHMGADSAFEFVASTTIVEMEFNTTTGPTFLNITDSLFNTFAESHASTGVVLDVKAVSKPSGSGLITVENPTSIINAPSNSTLKYGTSSTTTGSLGAWALVYWWSYALPTAAVTRMAHNPYWFFDSPLEIHRLGFAPVSAALSAPNLTLLGVS